MNPSQPKSPLRKLLEKPVSVMVVATLFVVLVCISLIALDAWRTWQARDIEMHDAEVVATNLAHSLAQHAEDVVLNADTTLMNLVDRIEQEGLGPTERVRLYSLMSAEVADSPWLHGLFVYDENGNWIVNSEAEHVQKLNNADREYFTYHRNNSDPGPYIGMPVRSRSTSDWIITVSRRINHPDGSFAGVALASISMDYFLRFYSSFDIGKEGAIDLLLDNGTLLVRRPFLESKVGTSLAKGRLFSELRKSWSGTATFASSLDGMERMNAYQHVEHYPLVVDVAMSEDEVLAKWKRNAYLNTAAVGMLVIVFSILGYLMIGHIRRRLVVERKLIESEKRLRTITDNMPAYISYIDRDQRYRFCNAQYLTSFNQDMEQLLGSSLLDLFGQEAYATIAPYVQRALAGEKLAFERQALERGGDCYSLYHYVPDMGRDGRVRGFYAMVLDITPRRAAELKLSAKEKLLRGLTDHLPALVSYIDRNEVFQFNNQPYEKWLDKPLSEITGHHVRDACGEEIYFKYKRFFDEALSGKKVDFAFARERDGVKHYYTAAYIPQFDEDGQVVGVCSMINDITDLKKVELQLIKLARYDSLTGLPNRIQFDESLRKAMARGRRGGLAMALMYLDIDHFKSINDTYGHQAGDEALIEFARRLTVSVRKTDQVARLSGDEFVIILEEMKSVEEAEIVARKVIHAMEQEFVLTATHYQVSTSIGIAVLRADDTDPQALLRRADQALYRAKHGGRNAYRLDGPEPEGA